MRLAKYLLALVTGLALAAACGSDEGETSGGGNKGGSGGGDSGLDSSFGGTGGSDPGCTSPNCSGCQGCFLMCMCQQNNANACLSQCQGSGGTSGAGGSGAGGSGAGGSGAGGSGAGGSGGGSCNPSFCPSSGFGMACCVTPNGPCGTNMGMGCMQSSGGG